MGKILIFNGLINSMFFLNYGGEEKMEVNLLTGYARTPYCSSADEAFVTTCFLVATASGAIFCVSRCALECYHLGERVDMSPSTQIFRLTVTAISSYFSLNAVHTMCGTMQRCLAIYLG